MFTRDLLDQFLDRFNEDKHERIVGVYITSLENHNAACHTALEDQNFQALQARVHDIKAIAFTLKYDEAGILALKIEENLIAGKADETCAQMPALFVCIENMLSILKDWG